MLYHRCCISSFLFILWLSPAQLIFCVFEIWCNQVIFYVIFDNARRLIKNQKFITQLSARWFFDKKRKLSDVSNVEQLTSKELSPFTRIYWSINLVNQTLMRCDSKTHHFTWLYGHEIWLIDRGIVSTSARYLFCIQKSTTVRTETLIDWKLLCNWENYFTRSLNIMTSLLAVRSHSQKAHKLKINESDWEFCGAVIISRYVCEVFVLCNC